MVGNNKVFIHLFSFLKIVFGGMQRQEDGYSWLKHVTPYISPLMPAVKAETHPSVHCLTSMSGGMQRQEDGYSRLKQVIK